MESKKRIFASLSIFLIVFLIGVGGFKIFGGEEASLLESIYMTVITISTIGYGEVIDTSANPAARIFTVVFIILSLGTIAFAVSSITAFIVEGELKNILGRKRMAKEISRLKDHYIICGSDETAETVIQELTLTKKKFVVVESLKENIEKLSSLGNVLFIQGDPSEDNILTSAGIEKAKGIFLSLPTDEANLFVTITARSLNPKIKIVAKGIDLSSHKKMMKAGADHVISPTYIGGMRMVSQMIRPLVVTFLDMMLRDRDKILRVEEATVKKDSSLVGNKIGESKIREKTGVLLVAIKRAETSEYEFNPSKETIIHEGDVFIFIASPEVVREVEEIAGGT